MRNGGGYLVQQLTHSCIAALVFPRRREKKPSSLFRVSSSGDRLFKAAKGGGGGGVVTLGHQAMGAVPFSGPKSISHARCLRVGIGH